MKDKKVDINKTAFTIVTGKNVTKNVSDLLLKLFTGMMYQVNAEETTLQTQGKYGNTERKLYLKITATIK